MGLALGGRPKKESALDEGQGVYTKSPPSLSTAHPAFLTAGQIPKHRRRFPDLEGAFPSALLATAD